MGEGLKAKDEGRRTKGFGMWVLECGGDAPPSLPDRDASSWKPPLPAGALGIEAASFASGYGKRRRERETESGENTGSGEKPCEQRYSGKPDAKRNAQKRLRTKDKGQKTKGEGIWDF